MSFYRGVFTFALFAASIGRGSWELTPEVKASPRRLAAELARLGVPGGIVVEQQDLGQVPAANGGSGDAFQGVDPVTTAIDEFNAGGPHYRALKADGLVHVRSVTEPPDLRLALDRQVEVASIAALPASDAVFVRVVKVLSGKEPAGIIGTGSFPGPECPLGTPVRVAAGLKSATQMLDEIVRQVPGLTWVITYDTQAPHYGLEVGLVCGNGAAVRITAFPP